MAQGAQRFHISETNPNDSIGGGGCLCSEGRCEDRGGPYAVFPHTETDSNLSPHVVLCAPCAVAVVEYVESGAERVLSGEPAITVEDAVEIPGTSTHVNPVTEGRYPDLDAIDPDLSI